MGRVLTVGETFPAARGRSRNAFGGEVGAGRCHPLGGAARACGDGTTRDRCPAKQGTWHFVLLCAPVVHRFKCFRNCGENIEVWAYARLTHCDKKHWSFTRQCAKEDICPRELSFSLSCCVWCAQSRSLRWGLQSSRVVELWGRLLIRMSVLLWGQRLNLVVVASRTAGSARDGVPSLPASAPFVPGQYLRVRLSGAQLE